MGLNLVKRLAILFLLCLIFLFDKGQKLNGWKYICCFSLISQVDSFVIPWTVVHRAPLSMEFPRQEYWSGLPCPSPENLPKPMSLALAGGFFTAEPPEKPEIIFCSSRWSQVILQQVFHQLGMQFNSKHEKWEISLNKEYFLSFVTIMSLIFYDIKSQYELCRKIFTSDL